MTRGGPISVNGRTYEWPARPLVVICVDGCEPDYLIQAYAAGAMGYVTCEEGIDAAYLAQARFEIEIADNRAAARASLRPPYDPDGLRIKS